MLLWLSEKHTLVKINKWCATSVTYSVTKSWPKTHFCKRMLIFFFPLILRTISDTALLPLSEPLLCAGSNHKICLLSITSSRLSKQAYQNQSLHSISEVGMNLIHKICMTKSFLQRDYCLKIWNGLLKLPKLFIFTYYMLATWQCLILSPCMRGEMLVCEHHWSWSP